jgi:hypothetical protein
VSAFVFTFTQARPALAADNVVDLRCQTTTTSLGQICVYVWFDNTNCTAHTTNNCSNLNGATVQRIQIKVEKGYVDTWDRLAMTFDVYGDGTSEYAPSADWWGQYTYLGNNVYEYVPVPEHPRANYVNRVCVRVRSAGAANVDQGVNIGGMNPYGLSQAGTCNLPL